MHYRSTYGVPNAMIELVQSLHYGMPASVMIRGGKLEPFSVQNGLQGYTIAPTLFILCFGVWIID